jgi:hypothetical protein
MNNQPSFDRGLFIPIGVGIFSLIGICIILVAGRITTLRGNVQEIPTATAFKYALVGTEPAITTVTLESTGLVPPAPTEAPAIFITSTRPSISTPTRAQLVTVSPGPSTITPTRTPTSASSAPLGAGRYDDVEGRLIYAGNWQVVSGTDYLSTLHVSVAVGDSVTFQFIGQELYVFFQGGSSLGTITLNMDGTNYPPKNEGDSTGSTQWVLPSVTNGVHTVTITHTNGGSVNLNYIIIPEVPATPTKTATSSTAP